MEVHTEKESGALIAKAQGRIDSANAHEFQDALQAAVGDNARVLILDFEALLYISSAGLRVILQVAKESLKRGGKFAVCSLPGPIRDIFEVSGSNKIIPTHGSRSEALVACAG